MKQKGVGMRKSRVVPIAHTVIVGKENIVPIQSGFFVDYD